MLLILGEYELLCTGIFIMMKPGSALGVFAGVAFQAMLAVPASAELLDPATLHTGTGAGTACATGGCYVYPSGAPNEVNGRVRAISIYTSSRTAPTRSTQYC